MPISEPFDDAPRPKLKLQVIRGGSGSGRKTAVAVHNHQPEDYAWPKVPGWFRMLAWWHIARWRRALQLKAPGEISEIMHAAEVSLPFRLLTYWRWQLWCVETINTSNANRIVDLLRQTKFANNVLDDAETTSAWLLSRNMILTPIQCYRKSHPGAQLRFTIKSKMDEGRHVWTARR
jgi:hypothetical protein